MLAAAPAAARQPLLMPLAQDQAVEAAWAAVPPAAPLVFDVPFALSRSDFNKLNAAIPGAIFRPQSTNLHDHPVLACERIVAQHLAVERLTAAGCGLIADVGGTNRNAGNPAIWSLRPVLGPADAVREHGAVGARCNCTLQTCPHVARCDGMMFIHSHYYISPRDICEALVVTRRRIAVIACHRFDRAAGSFHDEMNYARHHDGRLGQVTCRVGTGKFSHDPCDWIHDGHWTDGVNAMSWTHWRSVGTTHLYIVVEDVPRPIETVPTLLDLLDDATPGHTHLELNPSGLATRPASIIACGQALFRDGQSFALLTHGAPLVLPRDMVAALCRMATYHKRDPELRKNITSKARELVQSKHVPVQHQARAVAVCTTIAMTARLDAEIQELLVMNQSGHPTAVWAYRMLQRFGLQPRDKMATHARLLDMTGPDLYNETLAIVLVILTLGLVALARPDPFAAALWLFGAVLRSGVLPGSAAAFDFASLAVLALVLILTVLHRRCCGPPRPKRFARTRPAPIESQNSTSVPRPDIAPTARIVPAELPVEERKRVAATHEGLGLAGADPTFFQQTAGAQLLGLQNRQALEQKFNEPTCLAIRDFALQHLEFFFGPVRPWEHKDSDVPKPSYDVLYKRWNQRFSGTVQRQHDAARARLESGLATHAMVYFRSEMAKIEKGKPNGPFQERPSGDPRAILACRDELNVLTGPTMLWVADCIKSRMPNRHFHPAEWSSGWSAEKVGEWFRKSVGFGYRDAESEHIGPVDHVENDFSRFDASINGHMLETEALVLAALGVNSIELPGGGLFTDIFRKTFRKSGVSHHGVKFDIEDGRGSGEAWTSCMNWFQNALIHTYTYCTSFGCCPWTLCFPGNTSPAEHLAHSQHWRDDRVQTGVRQRTCGVRGCQLEGGAMVEYKDGRPSTRRWTYYSSVFNGDDGLCNVPREQAQGTHAEREFQRFAHRDADGDFNVDWEGTARAYGLRPETQVRENVVDVTFCSQLFWPVGDTYKLGPKLGRPLTRFGWLPTNPSQSYLKEVNEHAALTPSPLVPRAERAKISKAIQMRGVAVGMYRDTYHVPIVRWQVAAVMHKTRHLGMVPVPRPEDHKAHAARTTAATDETFMFLRDRYGLTAEDDHEFREAFFAADLGEQIVSERLLDVVADDIDYPAEVNGELRAASILGAIEDLALACDWWPANYLDLAERVLSWAFHLLLLASTVFLAALLGRVRPPLAGDDGPAEAPPAAAQAHPEWYDPHSNDYPQGYSAFGWAHVNHAAFDEPASVYGGDGGDNLPWARPYMSNHDGDHWRHRHEAGSLLATVGQWLASLLPASLVRVCAAWLVVAAAVYRFGCGPLLCAVARDILLAPWLEETLRHAWRPALSTAAIVLFELFTTVNLGGSVLSRVPSSIMHLVAATLPYDQALVVHMAFNAYAVYWNMVVLGRPTFMELPAPASVLRGLAPAAATAQSENRHTNTPSGLLPRIPELGNHMSRPRTSAVRGRPSTAPRAQHQAPRPAPAVARLASKPDTRDSMERVAHGGKDPARDRRPAPGPGSSRGRRAKHIVTRLIEHKGYSAAEEDSRRQRFRSEHQRRADESSRAVVPYVSGAPALRLPTSKPADASASARATSLSLGGGPRTIGTGVLRPAHQVYHRESRSGNRLRIDAKEWIKSIDGASYASNQIALHVKGNPRALGPKTAAAAGLREKFQFVERKVRTEAGHHVLPPFTVHLVSSSGTNEDGLPLGYFEQDVKDSDGITTGGIKTIAFAHDGVAFPAWEGGVWHVSPSLNGPYYVSGGTDERLDIQFVFNLYFVQPTTVKYECYIEYHLDMWDDKFDAGSIIAGGFQYYTNSPVTDNYFGATEATFRSVMAADALDTNLSVSYVGPYILSFGLESSNWWVFNMTVWATTYAGGSVFFQAVNDSGTVVGTTSTFGINSAGGTFAAGNAVGAYDYNAMQATPTAISVAMAVVYVTPMAITNGARWLRLVINGTITGGTYFAMTLAPYYAVDPTLAPTLGRICPSEQQIFGSAAAFEREFADSEERLEHKQLMATGGLEAVRRHRRGQAAIAPITVPLERRRRRGSEHEDKDLSSPADSPRLAPLGDRWVAVHDRREGVERKDHRPQADMVRDSLSVLSGNAQVAPAPQRSASAPRERRDH